MLGKSLSEGQITDLMFLNILGKKHNVEKKNGRLAIDRFK